MSGTSEILSEIKLRFSLKVDAGSARANPASEAQSALVHKNLKTELASVAVNNQIDYLPIQSR